MKNEGGQKEEEEEQEEERDKENENEKEKERKREGGREGRQARSRIAEKLSRRESIHEREPSFNFQR